MTWKNLIGALYAAALLPALLMPLSTAAQSSVIEVEQGTQRLLAQGNIVRRVAIGDPAVADVTVLNQRELMLTGKNLGVTSLIVWPAGAAPRREYRVKVVHPVDARADARIGADRDFARAQIDAGRSLSGTLPNLLAHRRARVVAQGNSKDAIGDSSGVELETQVMTEVKIAELSRTTLQQFGLNFFKNRGSTLAGQATPGSLSNVRSTTAPSTSTSTTNATSTTTMTSAMNAFLLNNDGTVPSPLQAAFNLVVGNPDRGLLGILSVLESKGMAHVLAEPTLLTTSGQSANYLAGGEFPVPVAQGGVGGGSISIEYKEFGVRLRLSPTVLAKSRISLKVAPEVSDLDFSAGIQIGGVAVPALTVRRTDTTVELGDGESFVISGLVSNNLTNNVSKVPWLGDIPVLGAFFRSTNFSKQEKELIMVVTPHLVRPLAQGARLPALPGAQYDRYDPGVGRTILLETGTFDTGYGR